VPFFRSSTMVTATAATTTKMNSIKSVTSDKISCTVPAVGGVDHVVLELVAALNDVSGVQFSDTTAATDAADAADTTGVASSVSTSPSISMETSSAFTGVSQIAVASGLAGSVRLLCGSNIGGMNGSSETTTTALVASWIQAAEQTVLPLVRRRRRDDVQRQQQQQRNNGT
jgi:hypothetical protein